MSLTAVLVAVLAQDGVVDEAVAVAVAVAEVAAAAEVGAVAKIEDLYIHPQIGLVGVADAPKEAIVPSVKISTLYNGF